MSDKGYTRRAVAIGGGIAAALGITALGVTMPRLLGHRYRQSAYDDLFAQLLDRGAAIQVGQAVINAYNHAPIFIEPRKPLNSIDLARDLRHRLERRTLAEVTSSDLAQSRLVEVQGWVLPETTVLLCILAAQEN